MKRWWIGPAVPCTTIPVDWEILSDPFAAVARLAQNPDNCAEIYLDLDRWGRSDLESIATLKRLNPALRVVGVYSPLGEDKANLAVELGADDVMAESVLESELRLGRISSVNGKGNGNGRTVLVAGTDTELIELLTDLLSEQGFHADTEAHWPSIAEHLAATSYDGAVVDVGSRREAVADLVEACTAGNPECELVLLVDFLRLEDAVHWRRAGAAHVLAKPFDNQAVVSALSTRHSPDTAEPCLTSQERLQPHLTREEVEALLDDHE